MIAGDRSLPAGQLQPHRASRKIRNDRFRRSKLHRRPVHRNLVSRENVDGAESKFGFMLVAQSISYTKKLALVRKMVFALPHISQCSPHNARRMPIVIDDNRLGFDQQAPDGSPADRLC
jgi:hypothetical protein